MSCTGSPSSWSSAMHSVMCHTCRTHLLEDLVDLFDGQTVSREPDFAVHPLWTLYEGSRARTSDVRRADHLVLALGVAVEGVAHGDGPAHLEEEWRVGEEVLHKLHGAEEGVA